MQYVWENGRTRGVGRESRGLGPLTIIHRTASRFHAVPCGFVEPYTVAQRLSLSVRYPNVFHLRGVLQKPAAFALFNAEPIDNPAFIAEDLLEVSRRRSLRDHSIGL